MLRFAIPNIYHNIGVQLYKNVSDPMKNESEDPTYLSVY
jgi:hypothetical protein